MKLRLISNTVVIASHHKMDNTLNPKDKRDFKFNIKLKDLAINKQLLMSMNLISMYADSDDDPVGFFLGYLQAFKPKLKPLLTKNTLLQIMTTSQSVQEKMMETDYCKALAKEVL